MYQLAGNNLPQYTNENSYNETKGIGTTFEWHPDIRDLEVGGGFVYIQPFRKGEKPEVNLNNGAIFFSYGNPEIMGALWYEDKEGTKLISKDKVIAFGSTVYLLIYTKDLYGQIINIQFKDDDSIKGENEENHSDDDLGIYPESDLRNIYTIESNLPANIKKDIQIARQVKTHELDMKPSDAISGLLVSEDADKTGKKATSKENVQGAFFSVYIDPFWSTEANDFLEGSEIEIFPNISNHKIKSTSILKSATLKVAKNGTPINPNMDRSNMPVLIGESEANYADFYNCRYSIIKGSYAKLDNRDDNEPVEVIIFNSNNIDPHRAELYMPVIAGNKQGRRNLKITTDAKTGDCVFEGDKIKDHTHKVFDLSLIQEAVVVEENTRVDERLIYSKNNFKIGNISFSKEEEGHKDTNDDNEINASHSTGRGSVNGPVGVSRTNKSTTFKDERKIGRYPNSDTEIVLDIGYQYEGSLIKYIWPTRKAIVQNYPVLLHTCAYSQKTLNVQVYPDIKWIVQFAYDCDPDEFNEMRGDAYDKYLVKVENLDNKYKPETIDSKIGRIEADLQNAKETKRVGNRNQRRSAESLISKLEEKKKKQETKKKKYNKQKHQANKQYKRDRPDLFNFKDNVNSAVSDLVISLNVEYDRPGEALEISGSYKRYISLVKQILEVKNMIELILDGKKKSKKKLEKKQKEIDENVAKENLKNIGNALKGRPLSSVDIIAPSLAILGSWHAENPKDINIDKVGIVGEIQIKAKPFIGAAVTLDFIALVQKAHPIARGIVTIIDVADAVGVGPKITLEVEVSGELEVEGKLMYNSASKNTNFNQNSLSKDSEDDSPLTVSGVFKLEVRGKIEFSKKANSYIFGSVTAYANAGFEVKTGITLSGAIKADDKGFFIDPLLTFHGLTVSGTIEAGFRAENNDGGEYFSESVEGSFELVLMHQYEGSFENSNGEKIQLYLT